jgi:hypothetical protein
VDRGEPEAESFVAVIGRNPATPRTHRARPFRPGSPVARSSRAG